MYGGSHERVSRYLCNGHKSASFTLSAHNSQVLRFTAARLSIIGERGLVMHLVSDLASLSG